MNTKWNQIEIDSSYVICKPEILNINTYIFYLYHDTYRSDIMLFIEA